MKRSRKLFALVIGAMLLMPSPTFAAAQGRCSSQDAAWVNLWENAHGDTADGNDSLSVCSSIPDLSKIDHTLPGNCNNGIPGGRPNWNDCVSSWSLFLKTNEYVACIYSNANYFAPSGHPLQVLLGPRTGQRYDFIGLGKDDTASSVRILFQAGGAHADACDAV